VPAAPVTTAVSNTVVKVSWITPLNGGSPITQYSIAIQKGHGTYASELANCDGSQQSVIAASSCTIPIATLQALLFNLGWASVFAKVIATNVVGSSFSSPEGNGVVILTYPDAPVSLANIAAQTDATKITLTWQ